MGRSPGPGRVATWLLLGASVVAAMTFVGVRLATPSDGGRIDFYANAWSAEGVRIAPIDRPADGLDAGDRVDRIAGRSLEAWAGSVLDPAVARPSDGSVPYLVARAGQPVELTVDWRTQPLGATLAEGWSVVAFSLAIAALAAFVFARRPDEPAATALVVIAAGAAGSSVPWFIGVTTSDLVLGTPFVLQSALTAGLYMVMWPAGLHLMLVFPDRAFVVKRHPRVISAVYLVPLSAYGVTLAVARLAAPSTLDWIGTWPVIQLAVIVPVVVVALVRFAWALVRADVPITRTRIRWAALGGIASALIGLSIFQIPELLLGRSLVPVSWIGLAALPLPLGFAAGILHDRLFDIEVVVNRALVYGGMTLGVITSYVVAVFALTTVVGREPGFGGSLLATGLAALVALPIRDVLQRGVNRLMYGERDEPWRAMRRLAQRLEWAADPDRAFPAIVETVAEALRIPSVALEVAGPDGVPSIVAQRGEVRGETVSIALLHGAEPVGRLLIGVRPGERGFRADERGLLEDLARQAGTAIRAVRLREDLARSREALVVAREEERRRLRRDLHDGLGPALAAIGLHAEASADLVRSDPAAAERRLRELGDEVGLALADIRRLVDGLRPPALDELGLVGAIRQQAERLEGGGATGGAGSGTGPRISVTGSGTLEGLPAAVEVAAFRIAVEAMTNAVRHADARSCRVRLALDDALSIEVVDDGRGMVEGTRSGVGLESMHHRAAEVGGMLVVDRGGDGGTRVTARLPVVLASSS